MKQGVGRQGKGERPEVEVETCTERETEKEKGDRQADSHIDSQRKTERGGG